MHLDSIQRIREPSIEVFRKQCFAKCRPVIITGVADKWPATSLWGLPYFKEKFSQVKVDVEVWEGAETESSAQHFFTHCKSVNMHFSAFADIVLAAEKPTKKYYLTNGRWASELDNDLGSLDHYIKVSEKWPEGIRKYLKAMPNIWVGPAGTVAPCHYDPTDNLLVQISGTKKITLFAPSDRRNLYYPCMELRDFFYCPVDIEHPDLDKFPRFVKAKPIQITLEAGEILYIPAGWWHHVRSLTPSISVTNGWNRLIPTRMTWSFHYRDLLKELANQWQQLLARRKCL